MVRTKKQKTIVIKRSQRCVTRYKRRREDRRETIERKFQRNMRYIRKLSNFDYANAFLIMLEIFSCDYFII